MRTRACHVGVQGAGSHRCPGIWSIRELVGAACDGVGIGECCIQFTNRGTRSGSALQNTVLYIILPVPISILTFEVAEQLFPFLLYAEKARDMFRERSITRVQNYVQNYYITIK